MAPGSRAVIPAPPAGFIVDGTTPAPPAGFVMDAPKSGPLAPDVSLRQAPYEFDPFTGGEKAEASLFDLFRTSPEQDRVKAANAVSLSEEYGVPPSIAYEHQDEISRGLGLAGQPTNQEFLEKLMMFPVAGALVSHPLAALIGLSGFMGLAEAENYLVSRAKGKPYQPFAGEDFASMAPAETADPVKDLLWVADMGVKALATGGLMGGGRWAGNRVAERWLRDTSETYNLPRKVYVDPEDIRSFYGTGERVTPEMDAILKDLGLDGATVRDGLKYGFDIEIPGERIVRVADKPWFAKIKEKLRLSPYEKVTTEGGGKPSAGRHVSGLLEEGPRSPEEMVADGAVADKAMEFSGEAPDLLRRDLQEAFRLSDEETDATMAILGARAERWGKITGRSPAEYVDQYFAGIFRGGVPGAAALMAKKGEGLSVETILRGEGMIPEGTTWETFISNFDRSDQVGYRNMFTWLDRYVALAEGRITNAELRTMKAQTIQILKNAQELWGQMYSEWEMPEHGDLVRQIPRVLAEVEASRSRAGLIVALDKVAALQHSTGGIIAAGSDISDYGPGEDWARIVLDALAGRGKALYEVRDVERYGDPGGRFFAPQGQAAPEYGCTLHRFKVDDSSLYKGTSSYDFVLSRVDLQAPDPLLEEFGLKNWQEAIDDWGTFDLGSEKWGQTGNENFLVMQRKAAEILKAEGYKGARWSDEDALNPQQYQVWDDSAILQGPGVTPPGQDVLFDRRPADPLYSQLFRVVSEKLTEMPAKAQSVVPWLQKQGVKPAEIRFMGVEAWLKEAQENGRIDREAFLEFLMEGQVVLDEKVLSGAGEPISYEELEELAPLAFDRLRRVDVDVVVPLEDDPTQINEEILFLFEEDFFRAHELEAELLDAGRYQALHIEDAVNAANRIQGHASVLFRDRMRSGSGTRYRDYTLEGGDNYKEMLFLWNPGGAGLVPTLFRSSHWSDENVLGHTRFQDFTDVNGEKVLLVEEVQSDWHQAGKREGYQDPVRRAAIEAESRKIEKLYANPDLLPESEAWGSLMSGFEAKYGHTGWLYKLTPDELAEHKKLEAAYLAAYEDIGRRREELDAERVRLRKTITMAPFADNWHEVLMKRMLRYAAEGGYDRIAWTTGKSQADRYNLAKYIDTVRSWKKPDGYSIDAYQDGGVVFSRGGLSEKDVVDVVGKDLARKITGTEEGTFSGLDLQVGGEGMASFYDNLLPGFMSKYVKPWGARVEQTRITYGQKVYEPEDIEPDITGDYAPREGAEPSGVEERSHPVHSVEINKAMREDVLYRGQPYYDRDPGSGARASVEFLEDGRAVIRAFEGADVASGLHEIAHVFRREVAETEPDLLASVEKDLGVEDGVWERENEEAFVDAFLSYVKEGKAPTSKLRQAFEKFRAWLIALYNRIRSLGKKPISQNLRDFFEDMLDAENPYFERKGASITVPVDRVVSRGPVEAGPYETAGQKMDAALEGTGKKRDPLSVYRMTDGRYKVVDGNTTLQQLVDRGEEKAIVRVKDRTGLLLQPVGTVEESAAVAMEKQAEFRSIVGGYAEQTGARVVDRPGSGIKDIEGIRRKSDLVGAQRVTDVLASTLAFPDEVSVMKALEVLSRDPRVIDVDNRYLNPLPVGYRDIKMILDVGGYKAELQLNTEWMLRVKELEHPFYEISRVLDRVQGAQEYKREFDDLSRKVYDFFGAEPSVENKGESSLALPEEIARPLISSVERLMTSETSTRLPSSIRNTLEDLLSTTKGAISYSKNNSAMAAPPFDSNMVKSSGEVKGNEGEQTPGKGGPQVLFDRRGSDDFGKGWFYVRGEGRLQPIDKGDLGPHGDHDGWISVGDNAEKLGLDLKKAEAFQAATYGFVAEDGPLAAFAIGQDYKYVDPWAENGPDFEKAFAEKYGFSPDEARSFRFPELMRIRYWPASKFVSIDVTEISNQTAREVADAVSKLGIGSDYQVGIYDDVSGGIIKMSYDAAVSLRTERDILRHKSRRPSVLYDEDVPDFDAVDRLRQDFLVLKAEADKRGVSVADYMREAGVDDETAQAILAAGPQAEKSGPDPFSPEEINMLLDMAARADAIRGWDEGTLRSYEDMQAKAARVAIEKVEKKALRAKAAADRQVKKHSMDAARETPVMAAMSEALSDGGFNYNSLREDYGKETIRELSRRRPGLVSRRGRATLDEIASMHGFETADTLMNAMLDVKTLKEYAEEARSDFEDRYADALDAEGDRAEFVLEVLREEEAMLSKLARGNKPAPATGLKKFIREETGQVRAEELMVSEYDALKASMKKAEQASRAAFRAGKYDGALEEKARQRYLAEFYRLKLEARAEVRRLHSSLLKISKDKKIPPDYQDRINALLADYDLLPRSEKGAAQVESLREFLDRKEQEGETVDIPRSLLGKLDRYGRVHWRDMTLDQLRDVHDQAQMLVHLAKLKEQLISRQKARNFESAVNAVVGTIMRNYPPAEEVDLATRLQAQSIREKVVESIDRYQAELTKPEYIARRLDRWEDQGVVWEYLYAPLKEASDREIQNQRFLVDRIKALFEPFTKKGGYKWANEKFKIPGVPEILTKEQIIMAALNTGNQGNLKALRSGYEWNDEQISKVLQVLSPEEWGLVRGVWDLYKTQFPALAEVYQNLTGARLRPVEGDYHPLVFDRKLSWIADKNAAEADVRDFFQSIYTKPKPASGFTIERKGGSLPPKLSFDVIFGHVTDVNHYTSHALAIRDVYKMVNDPRVRLAISDAIGEAQYQQFVPWLQEVAKPRIQPLTMVEKGLQTLRRNTTIVALGAKFSVAVAQWLGITQTIQEIGAFGTMKGLVKFYSAPREMAEVVNNLSPEMSIRTGAWDRELRDAYGRLGIEMFRGSQLVKDAFFSLISLMDMAVAYPTWVGAFEKGMGQFKGDEAKAVEYADAAVRRSQGNALPKDFANIQTGGELKKFVTMFYTFFSAMHNQLREAQVRRKAGDSGILDLVKAWWWIVVAPAVLGYMIRERDIPSVKTALKESLQYRLAGYPVVRDIASPAFSDMDYQFSPAARSGEVMSRTLGQLVEIPGGDADFDKLFRYGLESAGYAFGIPTGQALITIKGYQDFKDGYTSDLTRLLFREPREASADE